MANLDPLELSEENCFVFVEIWESFPVLWDCRNSQFKNKKAKAKALEEFCERFGHGWTTDQVSRKIDSLKACYRKVKSRKRAITGAPASQRKQWFLYDKIHSFYGSMNYMGAGVVRSNCPGDTETESFVVEINEDEDMQASGDVEFLQEQILQRQIADEARSRNPSGNSTSSSQPGTSGGNFADRPNCPQTKQLPTVAHGPKAAKISRVLGNRSASGPLQDDAKFQAAAVGFIEQLQEERKERTKPENPNTNFAMAIADDLWKIKSSKRLTILKNKISNLVHEALMEEMSDSD